MAVLVDVDHNGDIDSKSGVITHILDQMSPAGEYTLCGIAVVDVDYNTDGFVAVDSREGPISKCTCDGCNKVLEYYKNLK